VSDETPALYDRYTLFFDFLGTSNAAATWPRERIHQFVDLLIAIAQVQSAEDISGNSQADGSYRFAITPEVTVFSDNVVVSYSGVPQDTQPQKLLETVWAEIICKDAIRILCWVAEMGLRIGLLIRGGLSYGQLHHESGVVFGEAMVDAHKLEKEIAANPRIVVSERVIAKLGYALPGNMKDILLPDTDSTWHLNYFSAMMRQATLEPNGADKGIRWKAAHLELINREICELRCSTLPVASRCAEKWEWFKQQFEAATHEIRLQ